MTTNTQTEQPKPTNLGAFKTSKALTCLYTHAAPLLTETELAFIAEATNQALVEAGQMAVIIEGIGHFIENDEHCEKAAATGNDKTTEGSKT